MAKDPRRISITPDSRLIIKVENDDPVGTARYLLQLIIKEC